MASGCVIVPRRGYGPIKSVSHLQRALSCWAQNRINPSSFVNAEPCKIREPFNTYWNQVEFIKPAESSLPLKGNDFLHIHFHKWCPKAERYSQTQLQFFRWLPQEIRYSYFQTPSKFHVYLFFFLSSISVLVVLLLLLKWHFWFFYTFNNTIKTIASMEGFSKMEHLDEFYD